MKEAIGFLNWAYGKYFRKYNNNKAVWFNNEYDNLADYELFHKPHFTGEELFTEYLEWQTKVDARVNEKPFSNENFLLADVSGQVCDHKKQEVVEGIIFCKKCRETLGGGM